MPTLTQPPIHHQFSNNLSLWYSWQHHKLPLKLDMVFSDVKLLPLWHQWQIILPLNHCSLLFHKSHMMISYHHLPKWIHLEVGFITPICCLTYSNSSLSSGLVNISASFSLVATYSSLKILVATHSLKKWNLIGICLVFECMTGILEMLMAFVLSYVIGIGLVSSN